MRAQSLSHVRLLAAPWPVARQDPLPMEFSRQEYWMECVAFPPPGDLPDPESTPSLLHLLHWQADSLPLRHVGSPSRRSKIE